MCLDIMYFTVDSNSCHELQHISFLEKNGSSVFGLHILEFTNKHTRKKNYTFSIYLGIAPQLDVGFMTSRAQKVGFLVPLCQICLLPAAILSLPIADLL